MSQEQRFEYVRMSSNAKRGVCAWGVYDNQIGKFSPGLKREDYEALVSGEVSTDKYSWASPLKWSFARTEEAEEEAPQLHYSFPNWLYELVEEQWNAAIDRPKDFDKLPEKMKSAVLGTVQRSMDSTYPTAG